MIIQKKLFLYVLFLCALQTADALPLTEQLQQAGYVEIYNQHYEVEVFDTLYRCFDELIEFLQANPLWAQKLYSAKERFIRSKDKHYYSTDFVGFYDESKKEGRSQISFYYSIHFHEFICSHYPEFNNVFHVTSFLQTCFEIQQIYGTLCQQAAVQLGVERIFSSSSGHVPILFKVIKYLPSYCVTRPHYDGTVFSLFLDSTDNQSLLLSPYKESFSVGDFVAPLRRYARESCQKIIMLIPGALLTDFSIYPTPHIVAQSGKTRYAAIAFAMRPHYRAQLPSFSLLPTFKS